MTDRRGGPPAESTDFELLRSSVGDPEVFGVFYDRHIEPVLAFLYARTASADFAADLAAETFAQAFLIRRKFKDRGVPARAWLLGIARKKLGHALRRQRVEARALARLGVEPPSLVDHDIERIERLVDFAPMRAAMRDALKELTPAVSDAVVLRIAHELSYDEIASRLGCSEGAARVRVARGLSILTARMEGMRA